MYIFAIYLGKLTVVQKSSYASTNNKYPLMGNTDLWPSDSVTRGESL
jgi:hypothetical protein